jgi:hypothetical protein
MGGIEEGGHIRCQRSTQYSDVRIKNLLCREDSSREIQGTKLARVFLPANRLSLASSHCCVNRSFSRCWKIEKC